ncbi:hypothetical protein GC087_06720 [Pantoea sp. JZ2]|uniref:hypothetical protein n=1 Tax=Pantoea sp. JZ2 TaxID=2654189 RepID=UPI002B4725AF|nr:hypothetical protein [Pantoea sp. JZ2]WRH12328.1 hypothetical protein GC087_06720 [Pantoea sp. JZ2]
MDGNYNFSQVTYRGPEAIKGQSDDRLMKNMADAQHSPVNLADIKKRFEGMEKISFGNWPEANKI